MKQGLKERPFQTITETPFGNLNIFKQILTYIHVTTSYISAATNE